MSPKNKTSHIVNFLREANVKDYVNIMSNEDVMRELLKQSTNEVSKELAKKPNSVRAIADTFQSITTEATTVNELMTMLYNTYDEKTLNDIGTFMTIIHGSGDSIVGDESLKSTSFEGMSWALAHFSIPKKKPEPVPLLDAKPKKWKHDSTYGLLGPQSIKKLSQDDNNSTQIYNVEEICHAKAAVVQKGSSKNTKPQAKNKINAVNLDNRIAATKEKPSLAYILIDQPDLRIGTRNSLELATFFNLLSTVELSKCLPYLNAVFVLPNFIGSKNSSRTFKTASITQFFDGTPIGDDVTTDTYRTLEANFKRGVGSGETSTTQDAVDTNMSAFTMPQTINNFNETFIGHNENVVLNTDMNFTRATSVHDITRPFLTIKSFSIDVAPTQGLMSFKTGKLSLILHDRTRMVDIAPFIKPDLFGSFGAEIAVEYGWSHIDSIIKNNTVNHENVKNYLGEFLNASRVTEKYIITNSSFSMDNTGQVNIELSIAMRGPVDIRSVKLHSDPVAALLTSSVTLAKTVALQAIYDTNRALLIGGSKTTNMGQTNVRTVAVTKLTISENITDLITSEISAAGTDTKSLRSASLTLTKAICTAYTASGFRRKIQSATTTEKLFKAFSALQTTYAKNKKSQSTLIKFYGFEHKDAVTSGEKTVGSFTYSTIKLNARDDDHGIRKGNINKVRDNLLKLCDFIDSVKSEYIGEQSKLIATENKLINKIMGGLDEIDPFYNKEWLKQFHRIIEEQTDTEAGLPIQGINTTSGPTSYVTFGAFLTGLIGTHLTCSGKFNEIQIVSYTCNENCGLMSNLNVSSLLLPKKELKKFLAELFQDGTTFTLEGIISQIINRFISSRTNICYGLSSLYSRDSKTGNVKAKNKSKIQTRKINDKLRKIYYLLANKDIDPTLRASTISLDDVRFVMPKIKLTFDTLTTKKSGYDTTISRISVFDQNDNPFGSVNTIMKDVYDKGIISVSAQLNRLRKEYKGKATEEITKKIKVTKTVHDAPVVVPPTSHTPTAPFTLDVLIEQLYPSIAPYKQNFYPEKELIVKKGSRTVNTYKTVKTEKLKISKEQFYQKSWSYIQQLLDSGKLIELTPGIYEINDQFKLDTLKNSFKNIMPSLTYGTQNSAIIEASVSTVNEAKLNTIYLTRSDRAADDKNKIAAKVSFAKDLPLRVLPSQATVTMFGCPFVNFAQYIFLDFETGTTIDNSYAITGIKHDLTPGKFTTQLTLSYGDVYGKYENAAQTIARTINDIVKPDIITPASDVGDSISILTWGSKPANIEIGHRRVGGTNIPAVFSYINQSDIHVWEMYKLIFKINIIPTFTTATWLNKVSNNEFNVYIAINSKISDNPEPNTPLAINKTIDVDLDLFKGKKTLGPVLENIKNSMSSLININETPDTSTRNTKFLESITYDENKSKKLIDWIEDNPPKTGPPGIIYPDFIKDKNRIHFINKCVNENMFTLKFKLKFVYNGMSANYGQDDGPDGWPLSPTVEFDWNLFDRTKNLKVFSEFFDESELLKLKVTSDYSEYVGHLLNKVTTIKNVKNKASYYKKKQPLKAYLKDETYHLTVLGLEFEIISGITNVKKQKKKNTKTVDFEYKKIVISWKNLYNNVFDIKQSFDKQNIGNIEDIMEKIKKNSI